MCSNFNIKNTHVPDKVYAYMIQAFHMLYVLISCQRGDVVSMELFDDLGVNREENTVEAIQIKSVTSENNPVSNKSIDLWKTLYNWLMGVKNEEIPLEKTLFTLFITVNKSGDVVKAFNESKNNTEALNAWEETKELFFDGDTIKKKIPDAYKTYVETFFAEDNKTISVKIIESFCLKTCKQNYSDFVKDEARKLHIPSDIFSEVFKALLGWINLKIADCVESKKNILIKFDDFEKELSALYREYNQKYSLRSVTVQPSNGKIEEELSERKKYIEQLELIDAEYEDVLEAINDFLVAAGDRVRWGLDGKVSVQQIEEYEQSLLRHWKNKKRINDIECDKYEEKTGGKYLYAKCVDSKVDMETCSVPASFYNGCLHALSDTLKIGWHPKYIEIFEEKNYSGKSK